MVEDRNARHEQNEKRGGQSFNDPKKVPVPSSPPPAQKPKK